MLQAARLIGRNLGAVGVSQEVQLRGLTTLVRVSTHADWPAFYVTRVTTSFFHIR